VIEATTWTQLGIHDKREYYSSSLKFGPGPDIATKAVILLNVMKFWDPLRVLIETSIDAGFISEANRRLITFVDGPNALEEHESFDWGNAGLDALNTWEHA
jgi:predicted Rossmann-fold nucleotide-binding protein